MLFPAFKEDIQKILIKRNVILFLLQTNNQCENHYSKDKKRKGDEVEKEILFQGNGQKIFIYVLQTDSVSVPIRGTKYCHWRNAILQ